MSLERCNTLLKQSGENPQGPLLRLTFCLSSAQLDAKYTSLLVLSDTGEKLDKGDIQAWFHPQSCVLLDMSPV